MLKHHVLSLKEKIEEAVQRGDAEGQMAAAVEGLRMLLGGGKRYEPVNFDELKALLPQQLAGMTRTQAEGEMNAIAGIGVSTVRWSPNIVTHIRSLSL